jgi:uncharacterized protein YaeQ
VTLRASIHLNGRSAALTLFPVLQETTEHLLLKIAAFLFFFEKNPTIETAATHIALQGQDYWPDLLAADLTGGVTLWVECGKTTLHKLSKVSRRFRDARVIVLTTHPRQGRQQAEEVAREGLRGIEVWSFAEGEFQRWAAAAGEQNDIIGEASETSLNLVINSELYLTDLERIAVP